MWGIFGALFKVVAIGFGSLLILAGIFGEGDNALVTLGFIGAGVVVIGMGLGAWKMFSDVGQMQSARRPSFNPGHDRGTQIGLPRLPLVGVVFWMALGAVLTLVLLPFFPPELTEWVEQGRAWVVAKQAAYLAGR